MEGRYVLFVKKILFDNSFFTDNNLGLYHNGFLLDFCIYRDLLWFHCIFCIFIIAFMSYSYCLFSSANREKISRFYRYL